MEPPITNSEPPVAAKNVLHQVTPLSKYLAMVLFVAMPFLGGWIGYMYAPEKVVEVERTVYRDLVVSTSSQSTSEAVRLEDPMRVKFNEFMGSSRYDAETFYTRVDGSRTYYKTFLPDSSACCGVVTYDKGTESFATTSFGINVTIGETLSPDGRFYVRVVNPTSTRAELEVIDFETETVVRRIAPAEDETFMSSRCGYSGSEFAIDWSVNDSFDYGVYRESSWLPDSCEPQYIEWRVVRVR